MSLLRRARSIYDDYGLWSLILSTIKFVIRSTVIIFGNKLGSLIPRKTGIILFHNKSGYQGNSKIVFEHMLEKENMSIEPYWITHSIQLYFQLLRDGRPVVYTYSPAGLYYFACAAVFCYDEQQYNRFPESVEVLRLKHEIPVKRGSFKLKNDTKSESEDRSTERKSTGMKPDVDSTEYVFDHVLYPSKFLADDSLKSSNVNILSLGFPRNDTLLDVDKKQIKAWENYLEGYKPKRVILYAPSRRRFTYNSEIDLFPFNDFDSKALFKFLEDHDILLLLRLHPRDEHNIQSYPTRHDFDNLQGLIESLTQNERIRYAGTETFGETTEVMPFVDILITDYSTTYHTFLLLDRPIIFFPYDYETVYQTEGFKYNYYEKIPGPAIESFTAFQEYLLKLVNGDDPHKSKRQNLRNSLYKHQDAQACERVTNYIIELSLKRE